MDFLYYHTKLKILDLPYPQIGFDFRFFFLLPVKRVLQFFLCHIDYFLHNFQLKDAYSTNYVTKELLNGKSGFISLIEEEDFYNRFVQSSPDPLFVIIELQKNINKPIIIIPESIIYITKPMRKDPGLTDLLFGTHAKPGRIKRFLTICFDRIEVIKALNILFQSSPTSNCCWFMPIFIVFFQIINIKMKTSTFFS